MNTIKHLYIPNIDIKYTAKFIADVFNRNKIAKISVVYMEYKRGRHNKAYLEVDSWYETEAAYNFLCRLSHPRKEARIVYYDDDWWPVKVNRYYHDRNVTKEDEVYDQLDLAAMVGEAPAAPYKMIAPEKEQGEIDDTRMWTSSLSQAVF